jgi:hypothetical protein
LEVGLSKAFVFASRELGHLAMTCRFSLNRVWRLSSATGYRVVAITSRYGVCCNGHGGNGLLSAKSTAYESVGENSSDSLCSIIVNESFGELLREVEK